MYLFKSALFIICFLGLSVGTEAGNDLRPVQNNCTQTNVIIGNIGGPRDVVQTAIDIRVHQPTASDLIITIIKSNGEVLMTVSTDNLETIISTQDWESGNYTVETVDLVGDCQCFSISKQ